MTTIIQKIIEKKKLNKLIQSRDEAVKVFESQSKKLNTINGLSGFTLLTDYWESEIEKDYELLKLLKEKDSEERIRTQERLKMGEKFLNFISARSK